MQTRLQEVGRYSDVDILFLGSSHAYRGFDNRLFEAYGGWHCFNLGSSSQTPLQTRFLLGKYLDSLRPKLVIYEVFPSTLCSDGVESALDVIANEKMEGGLWAMGYQSPNIKVFHALAYASVADALGWDKNDKEPVQKGKDRYIKGGFVERKIEFNKNPKEPEKQNWIWNERQLSAFRDIVKQVKDAKCPLVLVYAPIGPKLYASYQNHDEMDSMMLARGCPYYDFNKILPMDDSLHFYDDNHLNGFGVRRFDERLIRCLVTDGLLVPVKGHETPQARL